MHCSSTVQFNNESPETNTKLKTRYDSRAFYERSTPVSGVNGQLIKQSVRANQMSTRQRFNNVKMSKAFRTTLLVDINDDVTRTKSGRRISYYRTDRILQTRVIVISVLA